MMTKYLNKFLIKMIEHYVPEGIDSYTNVNSRAFLYDLITELIEDGAVPLKLESIKYLCLNYRAVICAKLAALN